jgi:rRNA-processing protein FCF1
VLELPVIVVLDTNILTVPAQFSVDIFAESERVVERRIEFVVLKSVIQELERKLEDAVRTEKFKFRIALDFVKRCTIIGLDELSSLEPVDEQILEYALSVDGIVATNDKELRKKSLERGVPVLFMRGKKRLELQGTVR